MAPPPFRRRKAAKTVRNLAIAEAALALAKDRIAPRSHGSRRPRGKLLLLGGVAAAAGAAALFKRDKVAGLLPSHSGDSAPAAPAPPQPSNYDAPGPVANTATPIPAPDPHGEPPAAIDERAEEAAAAAEAAAIGGTAAGYAGPEPGEPAGEEFRPLAEAGEGESGGRELADADLADNAAYRDAGADDAERRIEDTIEQASRPGAGETPEPVASADLGPASDALQPIPQERFLPSPPLLGAEGTAAPAGETTPGGQSAPADGPGYGGEAAPGGETTAGGEPSPGDQTPSAGEPRAGETRSADEARPRESRSAGEPSPDESASAGEPRAGESAPADEPRAGESPSADETKPGDQTPSASGSDGQATTAAESSSAGDAAPSTGATDETLADTPGGGISGRPFAGLENPPTEPAPESAKDDDADDWRTWSGRSVKP